MTSQSFIIFYEISIQFCSEVALHILTENEMDRLEFLERLQLRFNSEFRMIGTKTLAVREGKASFKNLRIFAEPNSQLFLKVTTSAITQYFLEFSEKYSYFSDFNLQGTYTFIFSIEFRSCQIGEIFMKQTFLYLNLFFS